MMYNALSPTDYRYYAEELAPYLSEEATIAYQAKVEVALVAQLVEEKLFSQQVADDVAKAAQKVTVQDVYEEEKRIKHNIRALVNVLKKHAPEESHAAIHFAATSMDIVNTADAARAKDALQNVIIPKLVALEEELIQLANREASTVQIGRTHGQHAEPITFGYMIAGYVGRLGRRIELLAAQSKELRGKMSGAVGAYNATGLFLENPEEFEKKVLDRVGLQPAQHATQIVEPEYHTDIMHGVVSTFGVLADLADDMRHLQRSEIKEVAEKFEQAQVGSSTMPHKRNPIQFENVKSLWKSFMPRMVTVYMDQLSEHQRDLTNSASGKFSLELMAGLFIATKRMQKAMANIVVDKEHMQKNFDQSKDMIAAEPAYLLLASLGHDDAHEAVRTLTLQAEQSNTSFVEALLHNKDMGPYISKLTKDQLNILQNAEKYIGVADKKTKNITAQWEEKIRGLQTI